MRVWQVGDPVGMGEVYLRSITSKEAYNAACNEALLDSAARYAMELYNQGKCILFQRKLGPGKFAYVARKPLKL